MIGAVRKDIADLRQHHTKSRPSYVRFSCVGGGEPQAECEGERQRPESDRKRAPVEAQQDDGKRCGGSDRAEITHEDSASSHRGNPIGRPTRFNVPHHRHENDSGSGCDQAACRDCDPDFLRKPERERSRAHRDAAGDREPARPEHVGEHARGQLQQCVDPEEHDGYAGQCMRRHVEGRREREQQHRAARAMEQRHGIARGELCCSERGFRWECGHRFRPVSTARPCSGMSGHPSVHLHPFANRGTCPWRLPALRGARTIQTRRLEPPRPNGRYAARSVRNRTTPLRGHDCGWDRGVRCAGTCGGYAKAAQRADIFAATRSTTRRGSKEACFEAKAAALRL